MINRVDEFVLFDDVQYTRRDWRNRNLIKTKDGLKWLTIPVEVKGKFFQKIKDTRIMGRAWAKDHWKTICHNYSTAAYFGQYKAPLESAYLESEKEEFLSLVNFRFLSLINGILGIKTKISWSMDYQPLAEEKNERLIGLCRATGADSYLSGPAAKDYMDEELFRKSGIQLEYMDYSGYPLYPQLHGKFEHGVSIIDLLFNRGPQTVEYMKSFGSRPPSGKQD